MRRGEWHGQALATDRRFYLRIAPLQFPGVAFSLRSVESPTERFVPPDQVSIIRALSGDQEFFAYALSGSVTSGHTVEIGPAEGPWEMMIEGSAGELHLHAPSGAPARDEWSRLQERMEALRLRREQPWGTTQIAV